MRKTKRKIYSPIKTKFKPRRVKSKNKMPIFRVNIFIVVLAFGFIVGNLVMLNSITANGYKIKKIETNLLELKNQNQNLGLDLSDKQAMENVMAKLGDMNMVEAKNVSYITMPDTAVARK